MIAEGTERGLMDPKNGAFVSSIVVVEKYDALLNDKECQADQSQEISNSCGGCSVYLPSLMR